MADLYIWTNDGKIITDSSNKPILCRECSCAYCDYDIYLYGKLQINVHAGDNWCELVIGTIGGRYVGKSTPSAPWVGDWLYYDPEQGGTPIIEVSGIVTVRWMSPHPLIDPPTDLYVEGSQFARSYSTRIGVWEDADIQEFDHTCTKVGCNY